ncbi:MAG: GNAT family N-acetyltransferase [Burkholderiales bacterium]
MEPFPSESSAGLDDDVRAADVMEAAAYTDLYAAAPAALSAQLGFRAVEIDGAVALLAPRIPDAFFNRVIGLGRTSTPDAAAIGKIIALYRDAGARSWWIHVSPYAGTESLERDLLGQGFTRPARRSWAKVIRGPDPAPDVETSLDVREAAPAELGGMASAICEAYGMPAMFAPWFEAAGRRPAWRAFVARADDRIVGGGLLFLKDGSAWFGADGVLPAYRGRHAHRALIVRRIEAALAAGCRSLFTETGEPIGDEANPSLANMMRCGFRKVCSRMNYAAPAQ